MTRTRPSKRGPGTTTPRKLKLPDNDLAAGSPPSTPKRKSNPDFSVDRTWWFLAAAMCAVAAGVSAYWVWDGSYDVSNEHEQ